MSLMKATNPAPLTTDQQGSQNHVQEIKQEVSSLPQIYDVAVVKGKEDTLVAYKVKHMQRFRMKQIEKDVQKRLEKKFPKEKFTISSDYKIFLEAVRLNEHIKNPKYSERKAESRLKEIVKMTEDLK